MKSQIVTSKSGKSDKKREGLKKGIYEQFGDEMDFVTKTTVLGIFDFRAFLNIAMLITESERARLLRQAILDIVIESIKQIICANPRNLWTINFFAPLRLCAFA